MIGVVRASPYLSKLWNGQKGGTVSKTVPCPIHFVVIQTWIPLWKLDTRWLHSQPASILLQEHLHKTHQEAYWETYAYELDNVVDMERKRECLTIRCNVCIVN